MQEKSLLEEIIFLFELPPDIRDLSRFDIDRFYKNNIKVIFLDATKIIHNINDKPSDTLYNDTRVQLVRIENDNDLVKFCTNKVNKKVLLIDLIGAKQPSRLKVFRILSKYKIKYASFCANSIPRCPRKIISLSSIKDILYTTYLKSPFSGISAPTFIIVGGKKYNKKYPPASRKSIFIKAHTLDFDNIIKASNTNIIPNNSCIFLDEYFPFHPDNNIKEFLSLKIDPEVYYKALNNFFLKIEKQLKLKVIIACHPRSEYHRHKEYFNNRDKYIGKTVELVASSSLVIVHMSTSINYAAIYKKPIIVITTDALEHSCNGKEIKLFADCFRTKLINIDHLENDCVSSIKLQINEEKYNKYIDNYIKQSSSAQDLFWKIVLDNINKYNYVFER